MPVPRLNVERQLTPKAIAGAVYRRLNPSSTVGLPWRFEGELVTFAWDGFVAAPSIPLLFARHHYEVEIIRRLIGDPVDRSLEFGCGFGRLTPTFAALSRDHVAVDINGEALSAAHAAYPDLQFLLVDGGALPFEDRTFDLVASWTVVQHIPPNLIDATLAELKRVLKPGGRVLLCEETRLAGRENARVRMHAWHRDRAFYEERFAPLRPTFSSFVAEIDRLPGLDSPGRVMLFESEERAD